MESEENQSIAKFRQIPDQIRSFLLSEKVIAKRLEIRKKYDLSEKFLGLTRILNRIYDKETPFSSLANLLASEQAYAPTVAKEVALEISGHEFLPISSYLGDVESYIRSLGGNPADYPSERIILKTYRPSEVVTEVLHEHPVSVPAFLEHRLREILESRVREVRKDAETVQRLTRAEKIGGVELPQQEAEALVQALNSKMRSVKISADIEVAPPVVPSPEPAPVAIPVTGEITPPTPSYIKRGGEGSLSARDKSGHGVTAADEHEADEIRSKVLPKLLASEFFNLDGEIQDSTEKIFAVLGPKLPPSLQSRFRAIIDSRLRGVRDAAETRDLLTRLPQEGGLGLGQELATGILVELDRRAIFINSKKEEALRKEKESFVKTSVETAYAKDEARKSAGQEELDRMYGALTGNKKIRKGPVSEEPRTKNQIPSAVPAAPAPSSAPSAASIIPPIPLRPAAPTSPAVPITPPTHSYPKRGDGTPLPTPVSSKVEASPYMYTPPATVNPRIHDVRPVPRPAGAEQDAGSAGRNMGARLTGPVDELMNMTIADFRRLSSDPAEACRKITDKLDVLAEHAYARRIEGAKAWRESEVYKKYLDIINASFSSAKPIQTVISEEMSASRITLTEREVHAIMELNKGLKA